MTSDTNKGNNRSDDPRLTAYALGELDEAERIALEAELAEDAAAAEALESIQRTAALLREELAGELEQEPAGSLSEADRAAIAGRGAGLDRTGLDRGGRVLSLQRGLLLVGGLAAAGVALTLWLPRPLARLHAPQAVALGDGAEGAVPMRQMGYTGGPAPGSKPVLGRRSAAVAEGRPLDLRYYRGPSDAVPPERAQAPEVMFEDEVQLLESLGYAGDFAGEEYAPIVENPFVAVAEDPRSTFSIDVDTGSYANVRRMLNSGQLPPADAVRIEEMVNYFSYDYPLPAGRDPFSVSAEVTGCPWAPAHRLVRVALRGKPIPLYGQKEKNLVFLLDVSGSMNSPAKLPLLKRGLRLLVDELNESDRVSIVVYAGAAGMVLEPTPCDRKEVILQAIERLEAGGSTNGGQGIQLAYALAQRTFVEGGINRVILATDGDFNVGITGDGALVELIEEKARGGVFLSVLGFGGGNLKDAKMEQLADHGNGNYSYVDSLHEARKVLVREMGGTLETIAKDVKIQVEFNPAEVAGFRLIGYENRLLAHADFDDDSKDAGEIGAGHRVTALYEVVPAGVPLPQERPGEALRAIGYVEGEPEPEPELETGEDSLRYQRPVPTELTGAAASGEMLLLRLRYKDPDGDTSRLQEAVLHDAGRGWSEASEDLRFAAAVAAFGMALRDSRHLGDLDLAGVRRLAEEGAGPDPWGYRTEFLRLVDRALALRER